MWAPHAHLGLPNRKKKREGKSENAISRVGDKIGCVGGLIDQYLI